MPVSRPVIWRSNREFSIDGLLKSVRSSSGRLKYMQHLSLFTAGLLVSFTGCADWRKSKFEFEKGSTTSIPFVDSAPLYSCDAAYTNLELSTKVISLLKGRKATVEEDTSAALPDFDYTGFVNEALKSPESDFGISRFVSSLLGLTALLPDENDITSEKLALLGDLRQEAVILVTRNRDKPWSHFFATREIFCTARTGALYGIVTEITEPGFTGCQLPEDRAGFFGLISFLRAHPSGYYLVNNNYGRASQVAYLTQGIRLTGDPFRDKGEPGGLPLPACVPRLDTRNDLTDEPFGTVAVAEYGSICAGCHSNFLGPLSVAFRRFGPKGQRLEPADLPGIPQTADAVLTNMDLLGSLLSESQSCWAHAVGGEPQLFDGLAGMATLASTSPELGRALAQQIPEHLAEQLPNENSTWWVKKNYEAESKTLDNAVAGYLNSDSFKCKTPGKVLVAVPVEVTPGSCEEQTLAAFAANIAPVIGKVCVNCHAVGSGGLFLKADEHASNRENLLSYIAGDSSRLAVKIGSAASHGGGDRSGDLPVDMIRAWTSTEEQCGSL